MSVLVCGDTNKKRLLFCVAFPLADRGLGLNYPVVEEEMRNMMAVSMSLPRPNGLN